MAPKQLAVHGHLNLKKFPDVLHPAAPAPSTSKVAAGHPPVVAMRPQVHPLFGLHQFTWVPGPLSLCQSMEEILHQLYCCECGMESLSMVIVGDINWVTSSSTVSGQGNEERFALHVLAAGDQSERTSNPITSRDVSNCLKWYPGVRSATV